jgi:hypothetical protein
MNQRLKGGSSYFRFQNNFISTIDNIFVTHSRKGNYSILPLYYGLSHHNAQLILIHNIVLQFQPNKIQTMRKINKNSIMESIFNSSLESGDNIFEEKDVNTMFN